MATLNMVQAIRSTLEGEMERDERIILLGQDIANQEKLPDWRPGDQFHR